MSGTSIAALVLAPCLLLSACSSPLVQPTASSSGLDGAGVARVSPTAATLKPATFYVYSAAGGMVAGATVTVTDSQGDHTGITGGNGAVTITVSKTDASFDVTVTAPGYSPSSGSVIPHDTPRWNWIKLFPA